jgi:hypothetical protein
MTRGLTKLEDEMKLLIEGALGILDSRLETPPAIILWKVFARDLLRRIDNPILPRDGAIPVPQPPAPSLDASADRARDTVGTPNWLGGEGQAYRIRT